MAVEFPFLSEAWLRFEQLLALIPDVCLITTLDGRVESASPAAALLFNQPEPQLHNRSLLDFIAEEDKSFVAQKLSGLKYLREIGRWDARIHPHDHPLLIVEFRMSVQHHGMNGHGVVYWLVRDVTQRKSMEDRLRLSERLATLGTFASNVAHEINNPLASLLLTARHARRSTHRPEIIDSCLEDMIADAERCAEIIRKIRTFAKQQHTEKTVVDFNHLMRHIEAMARAAASEHGVELSMELEDGPLPVLCNPIALEQALVNLVTNALQLCNADRRLRVRTSAAKDKILALIQNAGVDDLDGSVIAQRFQRVPLSHIDFTNNSIGLITAYGIIHEHQGEMIIDSQPARGSTIYLQLPRSEKPLNTEFSDNNKNVTEKNIDHTSTAR